MVLGKTAKLVVFLIVTVKLSAEVCCDTMQCNLIPDQANCTRDASCFFDSGACRDQKCSDRGSRSSCEPENERMPTIICKFTDGGCVEAPSCSDWSDRITECIYHSENGTSCIVSGTVCQKGPTQPPPTCGDYVSQGTCEPPSSRSSLVCKWTGSACVTVNSCSELTSSSCSSKRVNNNICILDGAVCKGGTSCTDLSQTTSPSCSDYAFYGCISSSSGCQNRKCADYTTSSDCNSGNEVTNLVSVDIKYCHWNADGTCSVLNCGSITTGSSCPSPCYYLSSCPVVDNGTDTDTGFAAGISVPVLLVALLLVLFW